MAAATNSCPSSASRRPSRPPPPASPTAKRCGRWMARRSPPDRSALASRRKRRPWRAPPLELIDEAGTSPSVAWPIRRRGSRAGRRCSGPLGIGFIAPPSRPCDRAKFEGGVGEKAGLEPGDRIVARSTGQRSPPGDLVVGPGIGGKTPFSADGERMLAPVPSRSPEGARRTSVSHRRRMSPTAANPCGGRPDLLCPLSGPSKPAARFPGNLGNLPVQPCA